MSESESIPACPFGVGSSEFGDAYWPMSGRAALGGEPARLDAWRIPIRFLCPYADTNQGTPKWSVVEYWMMREAWKFWCTHAKADLRLLALSLSFALPLPLPLK